MDLNARVDIHFARVDVNFRTFTVTLFSNIFFFILMSINIKVICFNIGTSKNHEFSI